MACCSCPASFRSQPSCLPRQSSPCRRAHRFSGSVRYLAAIPSADPELTYTKSTVDGSDVYRFTLTKSRIAQIEIVTSDAAGFDGKNYTPAVKWTATQAVPEVRLSARIPQSAQIVQAAPGAALQPGDSGYSFYTKSVKDVKPGDQLDMTFSYQVGAAPASGASTRPPQARRRRSSSSLLLSQLAAFFIMAVRRKMTRLGRGYSKRAREVRQHPSLKSKAAASSRATEKAPLKVRGGIGPRRQA